MTKNKNRGTGAFHDKWDDQFPLYDSGVGSGSFKSKPACHESHPEIPLGKGVILGARCGSPRPGFDIYIAFDWSGKPHAKSAPWSPDYVPPPIYAEFQIRDMSVPKAAEKEDFDRMIQWMADNLNEGKRIHIGCIGGHGRTGLVLAVLVKHMLGEEDAIQWVRDHHCVKAVESAEQVDWLHKHYGIKKQKATKGWSGSTFDGKYGSHSASSATHGGGMGLSGKSPGGRALKKDEAAAQRGKSTAPGIDFPKSPISTRALHGRRLVPLNGRSRIIITD